MTNTKYNQLIESIEINKIELLALNCHQNKDFDSEKRSNIDIGVRNDIKDVKFEGFEMHVHFEFEITAFYNEDEGIEQEVEDIEETDILFEINFILNLKYYLEMEDVKDIMAELKDEIGTFVENNVPINAWPYARETISSITTRMGFPALVIPSFKNIPKI